MAIVLCCSIQRCEPTYKELKPCRVSAKDQKLHQSCEPTYKELKLLRFNVSFKRDMQSCEPTYKELKQIFLIMLIIKLLKLRAYL